VAGFKNYCCMPDATSVQQLLKNCNNHEQKIQSLTSMICLSLFMTRFIGW